MNIGLVIGKANSTGVPGKNLRPILGRPCAEYAFIAGKYSKIDKVFVSTDSEVIGSIGENYGAHFIRRPKELATPDSLTEDVLLHGYDSICQVVPQKEIKTITLLFCNNPAIDVEKLNQAIDFVSSTQEYDSCFSVARYDMFSPARARNLNAQGEILPAVSHEALGEVSSIRSSTGAVYYCDLSIQVMKPKCFEQMNDGKLPFKWQGQKSKGIEIDFGFDIDSEWQFVVMEYWLKKKGFTEVSIPWENYAQKESIKTETLLR